MKKPVTCDPREEVAYYYNEVMLEVSRVNATVARLLEKATKMKQILDEEYLRDFNESLEGNNINP